MRSPTLSYILYGPALLSLSLVTNTQVFILLQAAPQADTPMVDTAEQVYISSLALLKVGSW